MKRIVSVGRSLLVGVQRHKAAFALAVAVGGGVLGAALPSFADGTLMAATDLTTAFQTNTTSYINAVIPVILGIFGLFWGLGMFLGWGKRASH